MDLPASTTIAVDHREAPSPVLAYLQGDPGFHVELQHLPLGDYLINRRFLVERKTLPDLVESIKTQRLFSQALRLADCQCYRPLLLLEGSSRDLLGSRMRWEAIQGALVMIGLHIGIPILRSRNTEETVKTFRYIAQQDNALARGALARPGKRPKGKRAMQSHILQGLPGIGPERAEKLLNRFGSIEATLTAEADELASVPGIGGTTAHRIRWAVEEPAAPYC